MLQALWALDPVGMMQEAYTELYDPTNPPVKNVLPQEGDSFTLMMPYHDPKRKLFFEKVMRIHRTRRPGVFGYALLSDAESMNPKCIFDATALTGYRTAAKSLLFATLFFDNRGIHPQKIDIYGSSTQAFFHAALFVRHYPSSAVYVIARSSTSAAYVRSLLDEIDPDHKIVLIDQKSSEREGSDIIITTTGSEVPFITRRHARAGQLIIAVGSSSGERSEIDVAVVRESHRHIDSKISIPGKGEYAIPIREGLIERDSIVELFDVLMAGPKYCFESTKTALFVSKGLSIEDYIVARYLCDLGGR